MKITITQEFDTAEEAAGFLARFIHPVVTLPVAELTSEALAAFDTNRAGAVVAEQRPQRKPRADAGQPRGAYKRRGQNAEGAQAGTQPPEATGAPDAGGPGSDTAAPSAPVSPAPTQSASGGDTAAQPAPVAGEFPPTEDGCRAAMRILAKVPGKGMDANIATLRNFGVLRVSDLKPGQHAEFIKRVVEQIPATAPK